MYMETNEHKRYLTPPQVAKRLGVNPGKIAGFIKSGQIAAIDVSLNPGSGRPRWRITPEALADFEASRSNKPTTTRPKPRRRVARATSYYDS